MRISAPLALSIHRSTLEYCDSREGARSFHRDAVAKPHRDSRMNNESAVRFEPDEMAPPRYPGEVAPEDRFAVAPPSCVPRRECLWLMVALQRRLTVKTARKMRQFFA